MTDLAGSASGCFFTWRSCRAVNTQDSAMEATCMMLSMSILDTDSANRSTYIPSPANSSASKKRGSSPGFLRLLIVPTARSLATASIGANWTVTSTSQSDSGDETLIAWQATMHRDPALVS